MRLGTFLLMAILAAATITCSRPRVDGIPTIEEKDAPLLSTIRASDAAADSQFVSGFYPAEHDGWRWVRQHFAVVLEAPADAKEHGAVLELKWDAPQVVLDKVGPITLSASVAGVALPPETRDHSGVGTYHQTLTAAALPGHVVLIDFALDKVVKPFTNPGEDRELGVAVHAAALLPNTTPRGSSVP
jgi:hypothetical protein